MTTNIPTNQTDKLHYKPIYFIAFLLGTSWDILFSGSEKGISVTIFLSIYLAIFYFLPNVFHRVKDTFQYVLVGFILIISTFFVLFSNPILGSYNFVILIFLLILHSVFSLRCCEFEWHDIRILKYMIGLALSTLQHTATFFEKIDQLMQFKTQIYRKILLGILLSIPALLIFTFLLSSADMVFKEKIYEIANTLNFNDFLRHLLVIFIATIILFSYFTQSFIFQNINKDKKTLFVISYNRRWDTVILASFFAMLNLLFIAFVYIQFAYLFGGVEEVIGGSFTFAQYARKGFFEIIFVCAMNMSLILISCNLTQNQSTTAVFILKTLKISLSLCTFVLLFSSHFRLSLYEEFYGYTYLRLFSHLFIIFLGFTLILLIIKIIKDDFKLTKLVFLIFMLWYICLNLINIDAIIVKKNIEKYKEDKKIDLDYCLNLSYSAFPIILENVDIFDQYQQTKIRRQARFLNVTLKSESNKKWQSFNLSKEKAKQSINHYIVNLTYD